MAVLPFQQQLLTEQLVLTLTTVTPAEAGIAIPPLLVISPILNLDIQILSDGNSIAQDVHLHFPSRSIKGEAQAVHVPLVGLHSEQFGVLLAQVKC